MTYVVLVGGTEIKVEGTRYQINKFGALTIRKGTMPVATFRDWSFIMVNDEVNK